MVNSANVPKPPQRPRTVKKYLEIVRYAQGKGKGLNTVAEHFGISPATVVNASKAFGLKYEEIKRRASLPQIRIVEKGLAAERLIDERTQKIVELYNSQKAPTLEDIGQQVCLTRQRVHQILMEAKRKGIRIGRRKPSRGHWIERCQVCHQIRALAKHNSLMTTQGIAGQLKIPIWKVYWHLGRLKALGLVPKHFGHFRSERIIQAIKMYNQEPAISAWKLGRRLGYKNLPALFRELRRRGFGYLLVPRIVSSTSRKSAGVTRQPRGNAPQTAHSSWKRNPAKDANCHIS